ncbi:hypothetical protein Tco_1109089 [Tanacetum coccineum]
MRIPGNRSLSSMFGEAVLDLDTAGDLHREDGDCWIQCILGESARQFPDKGDLSAYRIGISSARDFLGTSPSYTLIRDPMLRLCHRLIACSIAGRSQALEKVTMTDLFYLRGMDVDSVNILYLLARYLGVFASGRKQGGYDIRGSICIEIDDNWAWVGSGPKRQSNAAAGAHEAAEDAPTVNEGTQAIPAPMQRPQPPPPPPVIGTTMPQRLGRLKEDVQGLRQDIESLYGLVKRSMTDQGRFSTWMISCMM